ncbi:MAG: DUF72 domain-containing protein [Armatimonadota bacterium]|nr:DUF72 domain-containing protein [Armatimonadota bacterium]
MEEVRVGCCGLPRGLGEYARTFPVVEIQQTFYQPPLPRTAARWRAQVPEEFEFTLKAWQLITHPPTSPTYRRLRQPLPAGSQERYGFFAPTREVQQAWDRTREVAEVLRARIVVFQCPARFTPDPPHIQNLRSFFTRLDRGGIRCAWEPRGAWPAELVVQLCRELDLLHCVDPFVTPPGYGHPRYFRLHGRHGYRYRYTDEDLLALRRMCSGATYVLFNNTYMWEDALRFQALLQAA